jgi:hypothetical protein
LRQKPEAVSDWVSGFPFCSSGFSADYGRQQWSGHDWCT